MELKKARQILSVLLVHLIAIGGILFFGAEIVKYTLCNNNYIVEVFSSSSFTAQCRENFKNHIEVISAKSNIPLDVFEAVMNSNSSPNKTAVQRLFNGGDAALYSEDLVQQFENLCTEYLDGNNITYDKDTIHNTAVYAAQVYSECFGIHNGEEAMSFVDNVNSSHGKYSSIGLLLIVVSIVLLMILFSKKTEMHVAILSAFTALGASLVLIGVFGLIFADGGNLVLSSELYASVLSKAVRGAYAATFVIGGIITALSVTGSVKRYKHSKKNNE